MSTRLYWSFWGVFVALTAIVAACRSERPERAENGLTPPAAETVASCHVPLPGRPARMRASRAEQGRAEATNEGMVAIPAGTFWMGADDEQARPDEYPKHRVFVDAFWMDATEVTNAQFARFVAATGYVTTAERKPDWEQLRAQLPPGTPRPPAESLVASSLVFKAPAQVVSLHDYGQWWHWVAGADWRHPEGPASSLAGRENHPVVQVSWEDAAAYAAWAGKRLPTEAEWEWAARGGRPDAMYPWGLEPVDAGTPRANTWQGRFPVTNTRRDGYERTSPVKTYPPNGFGLYDMAGNVWEWCSDWYRPDYYQTLARRGTARNPPGPAQSHDPDDPTIPKRVQRGGSYLCHNTYCSSYRSAARMKSSPDTGLSHAGFRCVRNR